MFGVNVLIIGYGQHHKRFQDILLVARERKYLLSTKARYAGNLCNGCFFGFD